MTIPSLLGQIASLIINPLIVLGFTIATIFLFYGIVELIWKADSGTDLGKNRNNILWGIIGLFIMFSVYGILRIVLDTFGIDCGGLFFCSL
jgi:hypothetical protein